MDSITWPHLIVLMSFGDGTEDAIRGETRWREVIPVDDDEDLPDA